MHSSKRNATILQAIKIPTFGSVAWFQSLQQVSACIMIHQDGSTSISIRTYTELMTSLQWVYNQSGTFPPYLKGGLACTCTCTCASHDSAKGEFSTSRSDYDSASRENSPTSHQEERKQKETSNSAHSLTHSLSHSPTVNHTTVLPPITAPFVFIEDDKIIYVTLHCVDTFPLTWGVLMYACTIHVHTISVIPCIPSPTSFDCLALKEGAL